MGRKPEKPDGLQLYVEVLVRILRDTAAICSLRSSVVDKDIETLRRRVRKEGLSFLTKTLPSLGKCLDKALAKDGPFSNVSSFSCKRDCAYPGFLSGYWEIIFNPDGTQVADDGYDPSIVKDEWKVANAVRAVRQICYLFYKLRGSCSESANAAVIDKFVATDASLPGREEEVPLSYRTLTVLDHARTLIHYVLKDFDPWNILPGHGPGAVATGEKPWNKMKFRRLYGSLEEEYPFVDYFFFSYTHLCDRLDTLSQLEEVESPTAKVELVPKDSRGPRLISMEPLEVQWIQQGLFRELVRIIESPRSLTCGYVNFTSQEVNRELARLSSNPYGDQSDLITLDMEEASDRVSAWLVRQLFPENLVKCFEAARSPMTELPDGHLLELKKFAPMGSAVCFPVEALIFWALAVGSGVDSGLNVRGDGHMTSLPEVWVYGDDIIATRGNYEVMRPVFEELFLRFNEDKCCTGRFFRESCGMDSYLQEPVMPIRIKAPWSRELSPEASLSYVSYVNSFRLSDYHLTADYLRRKVMEKVGPIPTTNREQAALFAFYEPFWENEQVLKSLHNTFRIRFNKRYQREEVYLPVLLPLEIKRGKPDWSELLRLARHIGSSSRFGSDEQGPRPCLYAVPRRLKRSGKWIASETLLQSS